jgi:hypothetical protein
VIWLAERRIDTAPQVALALELATLAGAVDGGANAIGVRGAEVVDGVSAVAAAVDFLRVSEALRGAGPVDPDLTLADDLRLEPVPEGA